MRHIGVTALTITATALTILQCSDNNPVSSGGGSQTDNVLWQLQSPYPTPETFSEVQFVDDQTAWAAGFAGTILHTSD